jgi:hypothetical protein
MTPQQFDEAIAKLKSLRGADMREQEGQELIETLIDLGAEFIKAQFISAAAVDRIAAAIEAQTKMMATVYSLDLNGQPVPANDPNQGKLPL